MSFPLPDFPLIAKQPTSLAYLALGVQTFHDAVLWTYQLPFGRNRDRANYMLIFDEKKGTCSTKHAALAALAAEHQMPVELVVGICLYEGELANMLGVKAFPEAHCYLKYQGSYTDITHKDLPPKQTHEVLEEHTIRPDQIGEFKLNLHKDYLKKWLHETQLDQKWSLDAFLEARDNWLSQL